ncbi:MAG: ribonuclease H-like domain-containing protein, partial [Ilumatobacteraceae bacterium]
LASVQRCEISNAAKTTPLEQLVAHAATLPEATPVASFVRGSARVAAFVDNGIATAADLASVEQVYVGLHGKPIGTLPNLVDLAWIATLGGNTPHRRRGIVDTGVPRADVEVDIDMECALDGRTYLWGTLLTVRSGRKIGVKQGYRAFVSWESPSAQSEASIFLEVWSWLIKVKFAALDRGQTFRVYCWHESAEISKLRRGAKLVGVPGVLAAINSFVADAELWVDLRREFDRVALSPVGTSLKTIAQFADFRWRDEAPGGDQSMVWFNAAANGAAGSQQRLLDYNEDDLRAGLAIREWLGRNVMRSLPEAG